MKRQINRGEVGRINRGRTVEKNEIEKWWEGRDRAMILKGVKLRNDRRRK